MIRPKPIGIVGYDSRGDFRDARGIEGNVLGKYWNTWWIGICRGSWREAVSILVNQLTVADCYSEQDLRALCPCDYEIGIFEAFE
jgi:hypothetical protein